jgi:Ser/Thr protein kinase RdoA (MazF antagonist)
MSSSNAALAVRLKPQAVQALSQYDLPEVVGLDLITFSENAVYLASFVDRAPVVVRLHSIGYHDRPAIESELMWVEALRRSGDIVTAPVLRARSGESVVTASAPGLPDRFAAVFEQLPGSEPAGDEMVRDFRLLGMTTARLHLHANRWERPAAFRRFAWDAAGTLGSQGNWGAWSNGPHLDEQLRAELEQAVELILARLDAYGTGPDRYGLIHADLRLTNLLVHGDTVQVIDFDDCGDGWFLYDLAGALTFMEDDHRVPALIDSWLAGYRAVRDLDEADIAEIPTFLMLRRLVIFAWLGSRPGTEIVLNEGERYARVTGELARAYLDTMESRQPLVG